jgi:hypothetical protein
MSLGVVMRSLWLAVEVVVFAHKPAGGPPAWGLVLH